MVRYLWPAAWIIWVTWFLAWEFTALGLGKPQWTLSEYVWRLEEINAGWTAVRYAVAVFCLWLFLHLAFGLFR